MTFALWDSKVACFLTAAGLSLVISLFSELRNWKFWDKRRKANRRITKVIVCLWVLFAPFALRTAFLQIGDPVRRPIWELSINGVVLPVSNDAMAFFARPMATVVVPTTNITQTITIGAHNIGALTAEKVVVDISFPSALTNYVSLSSVWGVQPSTSLTKDHKIIDGNDDLHYQVVSQMPIGCGALFRSPEMSLRPSHNAPLLFSISVWASSGGSEVAIFYGLVQIVKGVGPATLKASE